MEQTLEHSVALASFGACAPSPSAEKSYGIDPDYRFGAVPVWWRRILGPSSWSLVGSDVRSAGERSKPFNRSPLSFGTKKERGDQVPRSLNNGNQSALSGMPKDKSISGPMRTQSIAREATAATPALPMMPTAGKQKKPARPKPQPTRTDGVRVAKAKISRRNSLRKQREAMRG